MLRLEGTIIGNDPKRVVKVQFNYVDREYVCQLFVNGKHYQPADYFTDCKQDALGTGQAMANHGGHS